MSNRTEANSAFVDHATLHQIAANNREYGPSFDYSGKVLPRTLFTAEEIQTLNKELRAMIQHAPYLFEDQIALFKRERAELEDFVEKARPRDDAGRAVIAAYQNQIVILQDLLAARQVVEKPKANLISAPTANLALGTP